MHWSQIFSSHSVCCRYCRSAAVPLAYPSVLCNYNMVVVQCGHACFCKRAAHVRLLFCFVVLTGDTKSRLSPHQNDEWSELPVVVPAGKLLGI